MKGNDTLLRVKVQPKASKEGIRRGPDGTIRISVTAPPADDAANKAVIAFLAKLLRTGKKSIVLESGHRSRDKSFLIQNMSEGEVLQILEIRVLNG